MRRTQGYTAAMLVEESRMLQVSIFQALQDNLNKIDFSVLLVGVMAIADEVDSQLAQQMASFIAESKSEAETVVAWNSTPPASRIIRQAHTVWQLQHTNAAT
jgi:hypothetical protein